MCLLRKYLAFYYWVSYGELVLVTSDLFCVIFISSPASVSSLIIGEINSYPT